MRRAPLLLALLATPGLLACAPPEQVRYEKELREAPPASLHAVHSERLRELMRDIARLQHERLPQALDTRGEQRRRAAEVTRIAAALAESATRIAAAAPASLDASARRAFAEEARALESRARALAREAPSLPVPALEARVARVEATCDACHARFRVPGLLP